MKQGRTPDRVHVVRPPQDDYRPADIAPATAAAQPQPGSRGIEIIRTLAAISDKLKRSEAERYELLAELREYRKSLIELEDRAEKSEKAFVELESKLKVTDGNNTEVVQRQARFERALKETETKLVQAVAGQALLDKRIQDSEENSAAVSLRVDAALTEQARIDRQIEKIGQDRTRTLRKVERMEEILTETQDTLKARALILLTDQSAAAQAAGYPQLPAWSEKAADVANESAPWWRKSVRMQGVGMASMLVAALLFGWTINQIQQPDIPKIAILENGGLARVNLDENRWEAINGKDAVIAPVETPLATPEGTDTLTPQDTTDLMEGSPASAITGASQTPAAESVLNSSDAELLAALDADPDALASRLNEIAPAVQKDLELDDAPLKTPLASEQQTAPQGGNYNPLAKFADKAFTQNPKVVAEIKKEAGNGMLSARIQPDDSLPPTIAELQNQAFAGVPEAQHDLAAIYTAGRGGVTQNFEKAALWFREAADEGIANASYNLGVLYHQGLGVERNIDHALYWYRESAKLGHPEAQYNLGIAYIEGIGTDYNAEIAAAFFESSANQGVVEAAYNLGLIHENALIGKNSKQEDALLWYKIAADGGSTDAKSALQALASSLQIGMEDVDKMATRMQSIYTSEHGRAAGGTPRT
jgi:hypothetical protein